MGIQDRILDQKLLLIEPVIPLHLEWDQSHENPVHEPKEKQKLNTKYQQRSHLLYPV